mgnify:CR=1 FL=1
MALGSRYLRARILEIHTSHSQGGYVALHNSRRLSPGTPAAADPGRDCELLKASPLDRFWSAFWTYAFGYVRGPRYAVTITFLRK